MDRIRTASKFNRIESKETNDEKKSIMAKNDINWKVYRKI